MSRTSQPPADAQQIAPPPGGVIEASPMTENGLVIGVVCGVTGFVILIVVAVIIQRIFHRKKKNQQEQPDANVSHIQRDEEGKFYVPSATSVNEGGGGGGGGVGPRKSSSCPDIYAVNQSISFKMGPTSRLYQQLARDDNKNGGAGVVKLKSRSEELLGECSGSNKSLHKCSSKSSRDAKIFNDDEVDYLCQRPTVNTFTNNGRSHHVVAPSATDCTDYSNVRESAVSHPTSLKLSVNQTNSKDTDHLLSDYQSPTFSSCVQTSSNSSPLLIPKSRSFNVALLQDHCNEQLEGRDAIYDVPKARHGEEVEEECSNGAYMVPKQRSNTVGATDYRRKDLTTYAEKHDAAVFCPKPSPHVDGGEGEGTDNTTAYDVPVQKSHHSYVNVTFPFKGGNRKCKPKDIIENIKDDQHLSDDFFSSGEPSVLKKDRDLTYDVPQNANTTSADQDPTHYRNPTRNVSTKDKRSKHLVGLLGYDVPSTVPVFDPSQPSLLKQASKNFYTTSNNTKNPPLDQKVKTSGSTTVYDVPPTRGANGGGGGGEIKESRKENFGGIYENISPTNE